MNARARDSESSPAGRRHYDVQEEKIRGEFWPDVQLWPVVQSQEQMLQEETWTRETNPFNNSSLMMHVNTMAVSKFVHLSY